MVDTHVLVTGGRGFVGHAVISCILNETDWLISCPRRGMKYPDRIEELNIPANRLSDGSKIDYIVHAAGNASALACIDDPFEAIHSNVIETMRMLEIAKQNKVKHFIFVSSVEVYGGNLDVSYESDKCIARNPYAASKLAAEHMCTAYDNAFQVPCSIVRLNNTFGPRCQPERFPVAAIRKINQGEKFTLHCDEYGQVAKRRWLAIEDAADAIVFILKKQVPGYTYNVTGDLISNLELVQEIAKNLGKEFEYEIQPEGIKGRVICQNAPPTRLHLAGWKPRKKFSDRVKDFVQWTINNPTWLS